MGIMEIVENVQKVKDEAVDYYDKYSTMAYYAAYEEELMAEAYYEAERTLSEEYGTEVVLEPSVQMGRGCVDAYRGNGMGEHMATYEFEKETEAIWDIIRSGVASNEEELITAVAQKVVELVHTAMEQ